MNRRGAREVPRLELCLLCNQRGKCGLQPGGSTLKTMRTAGTYVPRLPHTGPTSTYLTYLPTYLGSSQQREDAYVCAFAANSAALGTLRGATNLGMLVSPMLPFPSVALNMDQEPGVEEP